MKAQILKRLESNGEILEVGDIVDVSTWRHTKSLENNRYIKIIKEEKPVTKVKVEEAKPKKTTKKESVEE
jgi:hypothetical protein